MVDLSVYTGEGVFGSAYRVMIDNDTHRAGSVDRVLPKNMIKLCQETASYLYKEYTPIATSYYKDTLPSLEEHVRRILNGINSFERRIETIAQFTSDLQLRAPNDIGSMVFGGTEEEIITRGSDWCTDIARVGCALCQVAGIPSRIVYLADTAKAYHGHAIIEVFRSHAWGAVDCSTNVVYRHADGKPASVWNLMNDPQLVESHYRGASTYYTNTGQFRETAIVNYFVWERELYDYSLSKVNEYKLSVLDMSEKGWPGGLRWLFGEDKPETGMA